MHSKPTHVNRPVLKRAVGEQTRLHDDPSTESGAEGLAQKIRTYWSDRGYAVTVQVERIEEVDDRRPAFRVTSDLKGGLPRRRI
jgi:hypothetical protein